MPYPCSGEDPDAPATVTVYVPAGRVKYLNPFDLVIFIDAADKVVKVSPAIN
jgi:hypothetical protein